MPTDGGLRAAVEAAKAHYAGAARKSNDLQRSTEAAFGPFCADLRVELGRIASPTETWFHAGYGRDPDNPHGVDCVQRSDRDTGSWWEARHEGWTLPLGAALEDIRGETDRSVPAWFDDMALLWISRSDGIGTATGSAYDASLRRSQPSRALPTWSSSRIGTSYSVTLDDHGALAFRVWSRQWDVVVSSLVEAVARSVARLDPS